MAEHAHSTPAPAAHFDPAADMLARLFPRWKGDASEPALPSPSRPKRSPPAAAACELVEA